MDTTLEVAMADEGKLAELARTRDVELVTISSRRLPRWAVLRWICVRLWRWVPRLGEVRTTYHVMGVDGQAVTVNKRGDDWTVSTRFEVVVKGQ